MWPFDEMITLWGIINGYCNSFLDYATTQIGLYEHSVNLCDISPLYSTMCLGIQNKCLNYHICPFSGRSIG